MSVRRLLIRSSIAAFGLVALAFLTEYALELRDVARFTPGQTFATVGKARIRYRLLGADHRGAAVVILSGLGGSIEASDELQSAVANAVPALSYDRAGYGFSEDSSAHSALEQAEELADLLQVLRIEAPVVLASYSASADLARVFAGRFPQRTAALYMIAPSMPDLHELVPRWHNPRRRYWRPTVYQLVTSSLGYLRLTQRLRDWQGPESPVEQRAQAVLVRRPHFWAQAQEWYALSDSSRQALEAPVPPALPIEIVLPQPVMEDDTSLAVAKLSAALAARSSRGKVVLLEHVDHSRLLKQGPLFDRMVARVQELSRSSSP